MHLFISMYPPILYSKDSQSHGLISYSKNDITRIHFTHFIALKKMQNENILSLTDQRDKREKPVSTQKCNTTIHCISNG